MPALSRPFIVAALLAMPLALAACKPMVMVADPVAIRQQIGLAGDMGVLPGGQVLINAEQVAQNPVAAKALAGQSVDFTQSQVLVVGLGERMTAGGSARIQAIQRKAGVLFVQAVIAEPPDAKLEDVKPTRLCVVAVVAKGPRFMINEQGIQTPILEPARVVVEIK